jgi:hypothetical protein
MKTIIYLVVHTDIWQSWNSLRIVGFDMTLSDAIKLAREDKDAVSDVRNEKGQIVIYKCENGELELGEQVFATDLDTNRLLIIHKEFRVGTLDSHGTGELYKYFDDETEAYEHFIDVRAKIIDGEHHSSDVWIEKVTGNPIDDISDVEYESTDTYCIDEDEIETE